MISLGMKLSPTGTESAIERKKREKDRKRKRESEWEREKEKVSEKERERKARRDIDRLNGAKENDLNKTKFIPLKISIS